MTSADPARPAEDATLPSVEAGAAYDDPALPAAAHLTGPGAAPLLAAAVAELGLELRAVRVDEVTHEPGRSCTVTYRVDVATAGTGAPAPEEVLVATTSADGPPAGAAVLEADGVRVGLWRYPFDPLLPALADAVVPDRAGDLLDRLLLDGRRLDGHHDHPTAGRGDPVDAVDVVTYRAGRRAVVRLRRQGWEAYLRVMRPQRADRLVLVHTRLAEAGVPVPPVLGADVGRGLVLTGSLSAAGGRMLRDRLGAADGGPLPPAVDLAPMLDRLAAVELDGRRARRDPLADVATHVGALSAVLPPEAGRLEELHGRLRVDEPGDPDAVGAGATVHGDLHDGQVVVSADGRVAGVLDLDDAGTGNRADDLGNLLGHITTMAAATADLGGDADRVRSWAAGIDDLAERCAVDPDEVRRRGAAVALSLATGPFRAREPDWEGRTRRRLDGVDDLLAIRRRR